MNRLLTTSAVALVLGLTLTACGSNSTTATDATGSSSNGANPEGGGRFNGAPSGNQSQFQVIQSCLQAAGLASALPTARPGGAPTDRPSGGAGGAPPSGGASGGPGGGGGFGQVFSDPQVQAALKACGITLPTAGPGGAPTGAASAAQ